MTTNQTVAEATGKSLASALLTDPGKYVATINEHAAVLKTLRSEAREHKGDRKWTVSALAKVADAFLVPEETASSWKAVADEAAAAARAAVDANTRLRQDLARVWVDTVPSFKNGPKGPELIKGIASDFARAIYPEARATKTVSTAYIMKATRDLGTFLVVAASEGQDGKHGVSRAEAAKAIRDKSKDEIAALVSTVAQTKALPEPEETPKAAAKRVAPVTGADVVSRVEAAGDFVREHSRALSAEQCDRVLAILSAMTERVRSQRGQGRSKPAPVQPKAPAKASAPKAEAKSA